MKKSIKLLLIAAVMGCFALVCTSCSEKAKAVSNLEDLAKDVQKNGDSYGFSEWMDVFNQYQTITAVVDKHYAEYSQSQHNRINKAKAAIKHSAWTSFEHKLDLFPSVKKSLMDLYFSIFGSPEEGASEQTE